MTRDINNLEKNLNYLAGLGNHHQTESIANSLPKYQNSPQKAPHGLYSEQISGSSFTTPRANTKFSWCYRAQPSVIHKPFTHNTSITKWQSPPFHNKPQSPNQYRWSPENHEFIKSAQHDFINGIVTIAGFGDPKTMQGSSAHKFNATKDMDIYFSNHDGDLLIVMQHGKALFTTEFGRLVVSVNQENSDIIVVPRGIKFKVEILSDYISGYIAEVYGAPLQLPELGPIGANGLANPRHFLYPVAYHEPQGIEKSDCHIQWLCKYQGNFWQAELPSSPINIIAWHGNYAPYKYNLKLYNTINTVSYDHPDPSIFTVLTSPSSTLGVANLDFVIFPERWMVAEKTFRPPYFHRNIMSEFMGLLKGNYDAKQTTDPKNGFLPGGISIHNRMSPHGPDCKTVLAAEQSPLNPEQYNGSLAFMFESNMAWDVTEDALNSDLLQTDYYKCWQDLPYRFST